MIQKKYNIQEFIGKGKFGSVFLGENQYTKEKVAIKLEDKSNNNEISVLKNETRILEYLSRNGLRTQIPQVFWFGIYNDIHYALVMTHLLGKSIDNFDFVLDEKTIHHWFISAINILEKIHRYGVIHRDIKPAHFIFVKQWVLIDFGFATFVPQKSVVSDSVKSEYIIGTPNYISLNIHNGFKPTPIDDIWAIVYIYIRILLPELFVFCIRALIEHKLLGS
jgi:serine/threonine-protein kinase